jgi:hypothetical protein
MSRYFLASMRDEVEILVAGRLESPVDCPVYVHVRLIVVNTTDVDEAVPAQVVSAFDKRLPRCLADRGAAPFDLGEFRIAYWFSTHATASIHLMSRPRSSRAPARTRATRWGALTAAIAVARTR